jgi:hypothetical protein
MDGLTCAFLGRDHAQVRRHAVRAGLLLFVIMRSFGETPTHLHRLLA